MREDFDTRLGRLADQAGGSVRLRPPSMIRARGDRRRTRARIGTAAVSAGVVGLGVSGVAVLVAKNNPGDGQRPPVAGSPSVTTSPTESSQPPAITDGMLLTPDDLNKHGTDWTETLTSHTDDGAFLRCQRDTLASLGATEVAVRTFERPAVDGGTTAAGHLIAYFPTQEAAEQAYGTLFGWQESCADYATGAGGEPALAGGDMLFDTVQPRGPERPTLGAAWQYMFDDNPDDLNAWFDSTGVGSVGQYLTIVNYGDYGQDANYLPEENPGVVLLQDAFEKLPS
ncbi:MAG: hypothetical protein L0Y54_19345 [Sporichthyaceae bacterium]|nr:hypothetical protein [Sporichthyaceae bacterium]